MKPKYAAFVALLALASASCARRVEMVSSPTVPAASAQLRVTTDDNDNTRVRFDVEHLASPRALTPPRSFYVVWIDPREGEARPLGELQVGSNLKARFETVTPYRDFELMVTAEDERLPAQPSEQIIFRRTVQR